MTSRRQQCAIGMIAATVVATALLISACVSSATIGATDEPAVETQDVVGPVFSSQPWVVPADIPGDAPNATLTDAATFAWQEFIALNWPAVAQTGVVGQRGSPDTTALFGTSPAGVVVWETFRGKVEVYPGQNGLATEVVAPNGYVNNAGASYGYDALPQYIYDPVSVGSYSSLPAGQIPPDVGQTPVAQPAWINLDEDNEIEEDAMFAGAADNTTFPGQQFLYAAKANRKEYTYIAGNEWWHVQGSGASQMPPMYNTANYVFENAATPPAGSSSLVSFLSGTIEMKSAWRRLTAAELASGRYHTNTIRYYVTQVPGQLYGGQPGNPTQPAYREEVWGLCALHIIHKTPTAPYFIYATFGQIDNILTADGQVVEDAPGNVILNTGLTPLDPPIISVAATSTSQQQVTAWGLFGDPAKRLYYLNLPGDLVPKGPVSINRRVHSIPSEVIAVNTTFQAAIVEYDSANGVTSPWRYYRLTNVQWKPLTKQTLGARYSGPNVESYYLSNIVVETDYNLQVFSGKLDDPADTDGLITDFYNTHNNSVGKYTYPVGAAAHNVPYAGRFYNMGGCMGCHGNIAELGTDFSFLLVGSSVSAPEFALDFK